jgi:hypothetical protein
MTEPLNRSYCERLTGALPTGPPAYAFAELDAIMAATILMRPPAEEVSLARFYLTENGDISHRARYAAKITS